MEYGLKCYYSVSNGDIRRCKDMNFFVKTNYKL